MNYSIPIDTTLDPIAACFKSDKHGFPHTDQSDWIEFAIRTTQHVSHILSIKNTDISLIELLQIIAYERRGFAQKQGGVSPELAEKFGLWRDGAYDVSTEQSTVALQRRLALNQSLQAAGHQPLVYGLDVAISHTCYVKGGTLFHDVINNLILSEKEDTGECLVSPAIDNTARQVVSQLMKQKVTISPPTFFDDIAYKQLTFTDKGSITGELTRFYMMGSQPSFFVLIEHPAPNVVCTLLKKEIGTLFYQLLACRHDKRLLIESLSEFLWYCHQLMPFERGSASIFLILSCALLASAGIMPIPYSGGRLDIDAISLTKTLFTEKFIETFND